jgi:hypothetical protein
MTEYLHAASLTSVVHPGEESSLALCVAWVEHVPMPMVAQLGDLPQPYLSQVSVTRFEREASPGGYTLELEPTGVFEPLPGEEER